MKKMAAKLFIILLVLSGIPNLGLANTNLLTGSATESLMSNAGILSVNPQNRYSIRIKNNSRWDIRRIYMSNAETNNWGPDQLGDDVLRTGGTFTLSNIRPAEYDIMFVDQDNDKCVLRNVPIFENKDWAISSDWLVKCQRGK